VRVGLRALPRSGFRALGRSGVQALGLLGFQAFGCSGCRAFGRAGVRAFWLSGLWAFDVDLEAACCTYAPDLDWQALRSGVHRWANVVIHEAIFPTGYSSHRLTQRKPPLLLVFEGTACEVKSRPICVGPSVQTALLL
jgi:hypothetical protein